MSTAVKWSRKNEDSLIGELLKQAEIFKTFKSVWKKNYLRNFASKWYLTIWWDFKEAQVTLTILISYLMLWVWSAMQQLFLWNLIMTYCLLALIKLCHINVFCYFMNISFMWAKINSILKIVDYCFQVNYYQFGIILVSQRCF